MLKYSRATDEDPLLLYAGDFRSHILCNKRIKIYRQPLKFFIILEWPFEGTGGVVRHILYFASI